VSLVRALRYWRRNLDVFLATWRTTILPPLLEPILYLIAFGAGVGVLIGGLTYRGQTISYIRFVAPGMIAVGVMFWAFFEGTYSVFVRFRYQRTQEAVMATPLTVEEIIVGEILWAATKGLVAGLVTSAVVAGLGLMAWPESALVLAVLPLGSLAFAVLGVFCCSLVGHINTINVPIFVFLWPMYLFSGTFFPLEVMPPWARGVAWVLPLTHYVHLVRSVTLGDLGPRLWASAAALVACAAAFAPPAVVLMRRRLVR
jgi:lipooligosaccharide transport system permease protein